MNMGIQDAVDLGWKLEAMVHLGIANSRMKDFFDVWFLAQTFAFDGATLSAAIRRNRLPIPLAPHSVRSASIGASRAARLAG